jgi:broad specificity phosphatase PhoE
MSLTLIKTGDISGDQLSQKGVNQANKTGEFLSHKISEQVVFVAKTNAAEETAMRIFARHPNVEIRFYPDVSITNNSIGIVGQRIDSSLQLVEQYCENGKDVFIVGNDQFLSLLLCSIVSGRVSTLQHLTKFQLPSCSISELSYIQTWIIHQLGKTEHISKML